MKHRIGPYEVLEVDGLLNPDSHKITASGRETVDIDEVLQYLVTEGIAHDIQALSINRESVLLYDVDTGEAIDFIKDAPVGKYTAQPGVLIGASKPTAAPADTVVVDGEVREMTSNEKSDRDARVAAEQQQAAVADMMKITFEDMSTKLPGLAWYVIESIGFTDAERKITILSLSEFYTFVQSGHVALAVSELAKTPAPDGVDSAKWAALVAAVQQVIDNAR
jgi:hypothetical protein